jgi:hypothetical protein
MGLFGFVFLGLNRVKIGFVRQKTIFLEGYVHHQGTKIDGEMPAYVRPRETYLQ